MATAETLQSHETQAGEESFDWKPYLFGIDGAQRFVAQLISVLPSEINGLRDAISSGISLRDIALKFLEKSRTWMDLFDTVSYQHIRNTSSTHTLSQEHVRNAISSAASTWVRNESNGSEFVIFECGPGPGATTKQTLEILHEALPDECKIVIRQEEIQPETALAAQIRAIELESEYEAKGRNVQIDVVIHDSALDAVDQPQHVDLALAIFSITYASINDQKLFLERMKKLGVEQIVIGFLANGFNSRKYLLLEGGWRQEWETITGLKEVPLQGGPLILNIALLIVRMLRGKSLSKRVNPYLKYTFGPGMDMTKQQKSTFFSYEVFKESWRKAKWLIQNPRPFLPLDERALDRAYGIVATLKKG